MKDKAFLYINSKFGESLFKKIGILKVLNNNFKIYYLSFDKGNQNSLNIQSRKKNFSSFLLFFIQSFKLRKISSIYRYNVIRKDLKILLFFSIVTLLKPLMFNLRFINYLKKKISINLSIDKIFKEKRCKYLIIFCSIYGQDEYDLIKAARINNIKSILVVDNWDNLSTKIPLVEKPDKLLVWGEEMIDCYNACNYVDERNVEIKIIGSPRFAFIKSKLSELNKNFKQKKILWEKKYDSNNNKKFILFIEHIRERNPLSILKLLDSSIKKNRLQDKVLIIYRPHPLRKNNIIDFNLLNSFKNVKVDKSLEKLLIKSQLRDLEDKDVPLINFLYSESMIFCDGFVSQISSALLDLIYLGKEGLLLSKGNPKKLFDKLLKSQCFDYMHHRVFKNKILNRKNIDKKLSNYAQNLVKKSYIKSNSKKINYIIQNINYDQFVLNLIKNIN